MGGRKSSGKSLTWGNFVKAVYKKNHKTNRNYKLGQAMKDASKLWKTTHRISGGNNNNNNNNQQDQNEQNNNQNNQNNQQNQNNQNNNQNNQNNQNQQNQNSLWGGRRRRHGCGKSARRSSSCRSSKSARSHRRRR